MKLSRTAMSIALLLGCSIAAQAQQAPKPEQLIKWRQSAFQVLNWNSARIKGNVEGSSYNKEEVVKSANLIAAIANGGLLSLFAPGTESGKGWHETLVKPELFKDSAKVSDLSGAFGKEANELLKVAENGDQEAVKAQFGKLSKTCKGCHDNFKNKE